MARPKKRPDEVKDDQVKVPLTAEQKGRIVAAARAAKLDTATWARDVLLQAAPEIKRPEGQRPKQRRTP